MFLTNRGKSEYYFPYMQIRAVARIDSVDFLNFDTWKGRNIHPPYFYGPRHLCQNVLPM